MSALIPRFESTNGRTMRGVLKVTTVGVSTQVGFSDFTADKIQGVDPMLAIHTDLAKKLAQEILVRGLYEIETVELHVTDFIQFNLSVRVVTGEKCNVIDTRRP